MTKMIWIKSLGKTVRIMKSIRMERIRRRIRRIRKRAKEHREALLWGRERSRG